MEMARRTYHKKHQIMIMSILTIVLTLFLTGCGKQNTPDKAVGLMFDSAKSLDIDSFNAVIAEDVKEELEEDINSVSEGFVETDPEEDIDYSQVEGLEQARTNLKAIMSDLSYNITNTEESEDTAVVTVEATYVDGEELISGTISDLFGKIMGQAITNEELTEEEYMNLMTKTFNNNYEEFDKELLNNTVDIHLIKDDNGDWLVSELDYDLINLLTFNFLDSMENIFSGLLGGFDTP